MRSGSHIAHVYSLWQDLSHGTMILDLLYFTWHCSLTYFLNNLNLCCYLVMVAVGERRFLLVTLIKVGSCLRLYVRRKMTSLCILVKTMLFILTQPLIPWTIMWAQNQFDWIIWETSVLGIVLKRLERCF